MGTHQVKAGEHMVRIAAELHIASYHTLWDHPSNADLAASRKNPNILLPGDVVSLSNPAPKKAAAQTLRKYKFVAATNDGLDFRIVLIDENGQPLPSMKCQLLEEGREATSDASGTVERQDLPPPFELGVLRFLYRTEDLSQRGVEPADIFTGNEEIRLSFAIAVGHLDPLDTPSGIQARLGNLGYYAGEIGYAEEDALALRCAIEEFEMENGLTSTGDATNASMQAKLKDIHGC
jgi:N-acetylmuramoyl-L-alanine amidase